MFEKIQPTITNYNTLVLLDTVGTETRDTVGAETEGDTIGVETEGETVGAEKKEREIFTSGRATTLQLLVQLSTLLVDVCYEVGVLKCPGELVVKMLQLF
jgi:hypothetical protein